MMMHEPSAEGIESRLETLSRHFSDMLEISASYESCGSDGNFGILAISSCRDQSTIIPAYSDYMRHLGFDPSAASDWRKIPPVPTSAFKSHDLSAAPVGSEVVTFETSGTTISRPGRVRLSSTVPYEASLAKSFATHLLPDHARLPALVFGPIRTDAPRSSLWFMVDRVVEKLTAGGTWIVRAGYPDWDLADAALERAEKGGTPILLLGTTLFFMAYFERLAAKGKMFSLPVGSRAMDTGGAKGQRAEFTRAEVAEAFHRHLGIPPTHLVNEYGMAEMGSQFYDDNLLALHEGRAAKPGKQIPPWVRTRVFHPETLEEQPDGERGILVHYDLANLEIPLAIQTEDIGSRVGDRLFLEGRLLGAEARGCSLAFERFLEHEQSAGSAPPTTRSAPPTAGRQP
jgi:acyl-protein synthetase LuxE